MKILIYPKNVPEPQPTRISAWLITSIQPLADLAVILIWLGLAIILIYAPGLSAGSFRILFALPLVLVIPGYLLIATLYPRRDELDWAERAILSVGLSIALVPLIGLVLNFSPWGIRLDSLLAAVSIFTLVMVVAATFRRLALADEDRLRVPATAALSAVRAEMFSPDQSRFDRTLSILLVVSIVVAICTMVFVIAMPKEGEHYSGFYLLGLEGKATDYPVSFPLCSTQGLIVGVENHEYRTITYTIETYALNQTFDQTTNTSTIRQMTLLDRYRIEVPHNKTGERRVNFTVSDPNCNKIQFLLFNETVPGETVTGRERIESSDRDLNLWVRVGKAPSS